MSNKKEIDELIEFLDEKLSKPACTFIHDSDIAKLTRIKEILQTQKPRVTREFVEKWVKLWMQDDADFIRRELLKMLKEAGMGVVE